MIHLAALLLGCASPESAPNTANAPRGSSPVEPADTALAGSGVSLPSPDADTGLYDYGLVTAIDIELPSADFDATSGVWFQATFALIADDGTPADHWMVGIPLHVECDGTTKWVTGVDNIPGFTVLVMGGDYANPRSVSVMVDGECETAALQAESPMYHKSPTVTGTSADFSVVAK